MSHPPQSEAAGPVTEDRLLGGMITLRQPATGLRAAIDPVLLAGAVPARGGETVLDLGTGTGVAAFCLARRVAAAVVGLEIQAELAGLARANAVLNRLAGRVAVVRGDVASAPFAAGCFDHVMANPPFLEAGTGTLPPDRAKARAVGEGAADLAAWIGAALRLVRRRGSVTIIHRADRLAAVLAGFGGAGGIVVFPLWPGDGKPAKRVLVQARPGIAAPLRLAPGLVLHAPGGAYTEAADAVLRDAAPLAL
jgi:tRNA1(Val) A37 N6-methylase TrmN6